MARLEGAYDQVSQRLMTIDPRLDGFDRGSDSRLDALDKKIDALDQKIDALESKTNRRFDALEAKLDRRFMLTIGLLYMICVTMTIVTICIHR
jgi:tetrahydromethanopterin S-methyltransferase subunit G